MGGQGLFFWDLGSLPNVEMHDCITATDHRQRDRRSCCHRWYHAPGKLGDKSTCLGSSRSGYGFLVEGVANCLYLGSLVSAFCWGRETTIPIGLWVKTLYPWWPNRIAFVRPRFPHHYQPLSSERSVPWKWWRRKSSRILGGWKSVICSWTQSDKFGPVEWFCGVSPAISGLPFLNHHNYGDCELYFYTTSI